MKYLIAVLVFLTIISCKQKPEDYLEYNISKGEITVTADESLKLLAEAQVNAYITRYPKVKINLILVPEQEAISLMIKDSAKVAIVSRELNKMEQDYFEKFKIAYQPANMAFDAVALIVNKNYPKDEITVDELKAMFINKEKGTKLVFDHSNSSNLNFMIDYFKLEELNNINIFGAEGTLDAFDYIKKNENSIGMIGYNWISDVDDKGSVERRNSVKLLKVKSDNSEEAQYPKLENFKGKKYPFVKTVIMHTTQEQWGVAKGFIRNSCTQIGQLVVEKMGLLPYYNIPKIVVIDQEPAEK